MSDLSTTVILTNFSVSLNLCIGEIDNYSIDNHAILDKFVILNNFGIVQINDKETYLYNTVVYIFYRYSISTEK